ncbi:hypothetical protein [Streptomyces sp. TRM75563]|uniref:hypothetical protein n=1 Tax=Streptomyces sp. TRM75563 TaxID=2817418 RepID=UPI001F623DBE|nr:hypothetical protein [Streptomyces sp. TRM75563]MCI4046136.1 hypothetical protein [Streptomyces sp. TRM75563]
MRRTRRFIAAVSLSLALTAGVAGCSEEETKTAPELPKQFCWNAFDRSEVQRILPTGDQLTQDTEDFFFTDRDRSISCLIRVDGGRGFSAHARFEDVEDIIEWSSFDRLKPDSVHVGKKAIVWNTGGITYFPCKATVDSGPSTAKYLELTIYVSGTRVENQRKTLPGLLEQFTAFAQKELKCA